MTALAAGFMVTPTVRLLRPLAKGGMGSVWVAQHQALQTEVAVKFLSHDLASDPISVKRFSREAAAASQVKSPHVVQTFDHGVTDDGLPFIVMELLEGEDLITKLERDGALPPAQVAEIIYQTSRALSRAHERGIVHRDIKPDNIFLVDTGHPGEVFVKLLDFGIAKGTVTDRLASNATATGGLVGTPNYMSPEQAIGSRTIDHRTDIWSLGMVAFEALTGRRAFQSETIGALIVAIHSAPLPRLTTYAPELPPEADLWFMTACNRDVNARFQTVREMADSFMGLVGAPRRGGMGEHSVERVVVPADLRAELTAQSTLDHPSSSNRRGQPSIGRTSSPVETPPSSRRSAGHLPTRSASPSPSPAPSVPTASPSTSVDGSARGGMRMLSLAEIPELPPPTSSSKQREPISSRRDEPSRRFQVPEDIAHGEQGGPGRISLAAPVRVPRKHLPREARGMKEGLPLTLIIGVLVLAIGALAAVTLYLRARAEASGELHDAPGAR